MGHDRVRARRQDLPGRHRRRRRPQPPGALGPDHDDRRPVRLRQDHHPADGQPDDRAHHGPDHLGRQPAALQAQDDAAPPDGLRHPERRAVPAPHGRREHRDGARPARLVEGQDAEAVAGAAGGRRPRPQAGRPLPGPALRRAAAARGGRARPGGRPAGDADGRALLGRRPGGPRRAARVLPRACSARSARRSSSSRTTSRRPSSWATRWPSCASAVTSPRSAPRSSCWTSRPTPSSRASSAATAATARCPSCPPPALDLDERAGRPRGRAPPRRRARRWSSTATPGRSAGSPPGEPGRTRPLGSTFDVEAGTLRNALDAVLTSPVGLAVGVGPGTGRYAGRRVHGDDPRRRAPGPGAPGRRSPAARGGSTRPDAGRTPSDDRDRADAAADGAASDVAGQDERAPPTDSGRRTPTRDPTPVPTATGRRRPQRPRARPSARCRRDRSRGAGHRAPRAEARASPTPSTRRRAAARRDGRPPMNWGWIQNNLGLIGSLLARARPARGGPGAGRPGPRPAARLPRLPHRHGPPTRSWRCSASSTRSRRWPCSSPCRSCWAPGSSTRSTSRSRSPSTPSPCSSAASSTGCARSRPTSSSPPRRSGSAVGPAAPGGAAAGHAGRLRRPPGGHRVQHRAGHRRGPGGQRRPGPAVPPRPTTASSTPR